MLTFSMRHCFVPMRGAPQTRAPYPTASHNCLVSIDDMWRRTNGHRSRMGSAPASPQTTAASGVATLRQASSFGPCTKNRVRSPRQRAGICGPATQDEAYRRIYHQKWCSVAELQDRGAGAALTGTSACSRTLPKQGCDQYTGQYPTYVRCIGLCWKANNILLVVLACVRVLGHIKQSFSVLFPNLTHASQPAVQGPTT